MENNKNHAQREVNQEYQAEVSNVSHSRKPSRWKLALFFLLLALIPIGFMGKELYKSYLQQQEEKPASDTFSFKSKPRDFAKPVETKPDVFIPESSNETPQNEATQVAPKIFATDLDDTNEPLPPPKLIKSKSSLSVEGKSLSSSTDIDPSVESNSPHLEASRVLSDSQGGGSGDIFQSTAYSARKAKKSAFNPNLLLKKGTFIQCSLRTKVVSTIAGNLGCIVAHDVYSANGTVLLVERGSEIFGEFRSGQIKQGEDRIFVIWSEIRTPKNVVIEVDSGATDELGGTGIQGWTDTHFWERLGGGILLSLIDDTAGYLAYRQERKSGYDFTQSSREATQQMAQTAIEKMIDIPPTLYKNHGDLVGVFVARDIDFSSVYKLRRK